MRLRGGEESAAAWTSKAPRRVSCSIGPLFKRLITRAAALFDVTQLRHLLIGEIEPQNRARLIPESADPIHEAL